MVTMEMETDVKPKQRMMENGPYWEKFEHLEHTVKEPTWVRSIRRAGITYFAEVGFPTLKDEDWRFTNVSPIAKLPFKPVLDAALDSLDLELLSRAAIGAFPVAFHTLKGSRLVFVNGHYLKERNYSAQFIPVSGRSAG